MKIRTKYREQIAFTPKKKPQNSLSLSPNGPNLSIRLLEGIKTKGTMDVSVVLGILSFLARVVQLGSSQEKVKFKDKDCNLTSTLHNSIFLASLERIEFSHSFLVSSSTDLLHPASSDLGADSALYDKLSNKKLDEKGERIVKGTMRERKNP